MGLVSIKVSDRIFEFVASRINSTLLSKAYKDAEYIDIHEGGESSLQDRLENETDEETTMLNVIGEQPNGACEDIMVHGNVESLH